MVRNIQYMMNWNIGIPKDDRLFRGSAEYEENRNWKIYKVSLGNRLPYLDKMNVNLSFRTN